MIYIIGDGGHARVVADVIFTMGLDCTMLSPANEELKLANNREDDGSYKYVAIGVGMAKHKDEICPSLMLRYSIMLKYSARDFGFPCLIHKGATVATPGRLGFGSQVMAGAILQPRSKLGDCCIINTGAQVDHDCLIGMGTHIAPGAIICGGCTIGDCTLVGANATVLPGVKVGNHVVVPAGSTVRKDIE
jgi:UDP-perosamine 4-acetyltransferase